MSYRPDIILYQGDDEIELPLKWCICNACRGNGKSSAYLGAITQGDREPGGTWDDPGDFAEYMRGGYDRTCDACNGSGKVQVVDEDALDAETRKAWHEQCREEAEYRRACRAERDMGA